MKIILLDDENSEKWDEFVMSNPEGTFGHLYGWKEVYKIYGYKAFSIAVIDNSDSILGVLQLFLMRDIFNRKFLISNPFLSYAGVCSNDKEVRLEILSKAKEIAAENKVQYIELRQLADKAYNLPTKKSFLTMVLNLSNEDELIWKNSLKSVTRNRIRKAYKQNFQIDYGRDYLDDFYSVLSTNFRDLGTPIFPKLFFRNIFDKFSNLTDLIVVKYKNKVVGGMLVMGYKNMFSDLWVSTLRKYNDLCPNELLYWEAIKFACRNGFEYFDFGRSSINQGTFNFKKKWGAKPVPLYYQYYLNRANSISQINAVQNSKYQLAIKIWKRLPLIIANRIGPIVVRYLPEF